MSMEASITAPYLRMRDAVALGGLSRSTLYAHIRSGELQHVKRHGRTLIGGESLIRLLASRTILRPARAEAIRAEMARMAVPLDFAFDGDRWLGIWLELGGGLAVAETVTLTVPLAGEGDAARADHLRTGLANLGSIAAIRAASIRRLGS